MIYFAWEFNAVYIVFILPKTHTRRRDMSSWAAISGRIIPSTCKQEFDAEIDEF